MTIEISGRDASSCKFHAEAIFLGSPISQATGRRIVLAGPTGSEPLVGLRLALEQMTTPALVSDVQVGTSSAASGCSAAAPSQLTQRHPEGITLSVWDAAWGSPPMCVLTIEGAGERLRSADCGPAGPALAPAVFDEPHHQSLELLAARALENGDFLTAYMLSDRRCRIPPVSKPHCYVLRAIASFELGERADAISDIEKALEIAPEDIPANRRMLAWGNRRQCLRAADVLVTVERDFAMLRRAIAILIEGGRTRFGQLRVTNDALKGWVAWTDAGHAEIAIDDDANLVTVQIAPQQSHLLSAIGHAANFEIFRPRSSRPQSIWVSVGGEAVCSTRAAANDPTRASNSTARAAASRRPGPCHCGDARLCGLSGHESLPR